MKFKRFCLSVLKSALYALLFFGAQFGVTIALVLFLLMLSPILVHLTGSPAFAQSIEQNMIAIVTVLSNTLFLCVLLLWFAARGRSLSREVVWHRMPRAALAVLGPIEVGFGASILASFALTLLPVSEEISTKYDESMQMLSAADPIPLFLATVIAAPIAEEVLFRGLVYTRLRSAVCRPAAALLSAVVFGLV
ncbi:MAG: CPBP family intramembrane metalloprotease, partial [Lentisphaeria bacterium]|nr:CPBP family intramembrane metalloprotease [Lentisphaeria bacterium]